MFRIQLIPHNILLGCSMILQCIHFIKVLESQNVLFLYDAYSFMRTLYIFLVFRPCLCLNEWCVSQIVQRA
uniref:Uncharacterized protein n=1 Tax=Arundo donax TaxID=35708 RepID=A0A0A9HHQ6_ARUDO